MKRTVTLLVALALAAGAYWLVRPWLSSDERAIREQLDELAETANLRGQEPVPARLARAARIGQYFTPQVTIEVGRPFATIKGREAVVALAASAPVPQQGLTIRFVDVQVWLGSDRKTAAAYLTVSGAVPDGSGAEAVDARELEMSFQKVDGEWLIERVKTVSPLEPVR